MELLLVGVNTQVAVAGVHIDQRREQPHVGVGRRHGPHAPRATRRRSRATYAGDASRAWSSGVPIGLIPQVCWYRACTRRTVWVPGDRSPADWFLPQSRLHRKRMDHQIARTANRSTRLRVQLVLVYLRLRTWKGKASNQKNIRSANSVRAGKESK